MKRILAALALGVAASFAYAQDESRTYAPDSDQTYAPDEDGNYVPDEDRTYVPDEDRAYIPDEDRANVPDEDETYTPVQDQTYAQDETLAPIVVEGTDVDRIVFECEPPNGAAACANFHELIRENFTPREISMLFGGSTAHFEYPVNYDRVRERYIALLQNVRENGMPVPVNDQY